MSAPKSDQIVLSRDYVPNPGEKIWIVIKPSSWANVFRGRRWMNNEELVAAVTAAKESIRREFPGEFTPTGRIYYLPDPEQPEEIHLELEAGGTPSIAFLIGLGIAAAGVTALAFTVDRVYKITEKAPVVAGLGFGSIILFVGLGALALRQFRGALNV